jgi:hypothetical protein
LLQDARRVARSPARDAVADLEALPGAVGDSGHERVTFGELMKGDDDGID